ncbi:MAG: hypothetical protein Fur0022_45920 [Anaerolineales bacterium]
MTRPDAIRSLALICAIQRTALLSSDHLISSRVNLEEVAHIQLTSANEDIIDIQKLDGFLIQPDHGVSLIVFSNPIFPAENIVGDSGNLLYLNEVVYGINSAGNGICGVITDLEAIYQTVQTLITALQQQALPKVSN